ncbi:MAG TPA: M3 family oligoendopeptidase [Anaerolineae bacterium]|nr:M3 family oligoendopeptidase [Anaerolineae bacterium]
MLQNLPSSTENLLKWTWVEIEPYYKELKDRPLTEENVNAWLKDWSDLSRHVSEINWRLEVLTTVDTSNKKSEEALKKFFDKIFPNMQKGENDLKKKLLESGLEPKGFEIALRNMRAEADLFRDENLPIISEEQKICLDYDKIAGAQTVLWEGEERTIMQMSPLQLENDRAIREKAFKLVIERQFADFESLGEVWSRLMPLRRKIAENAGKKDYREYMWQQKLRFDYTPQDAKSFHNAIEEVVVPAVVRAYERRRKRLNVDTLRPWDTKVDQFGNEPLRPFKTMDELNAGTKLIFDNVDPELGRRFQVMIDEGLLDLDNRKNKAPGGYCTMFPVSNRPFIFMNSVGTHQDVQTLLHEGGHSFHVFETANIDLIHNINTPMEFNEVASMAMELLASPKLIESGMYTESETARARIEHLEICLLLWTLLAQADAFTHWIYENHDLATDPVKCSEQWSLLHDRYMAGPDWSGLEQYKAASWQAILHFYKYPFYIIEYALAQLGAAQIWANSLTDYEGAVKAYRKALSLGSTVTLPELYNAANAKFAFDAPTLKRSVDLMEQIIEDMESKL